MAKSGKKDSQRKKDNLQAKAGSGSIVKAKEKRKKTNTKKVTGKLAEDIKNADDEFQKLQPKLVSEKENKKMLSEDKEASTSKVASEAPISQEKKVEETTQVLACL